MNDQIVLDGITYIRLDAANIPAKSIDEMSYVIVRAVSAGVFAGYLAQRDGSEVVLRQVRRLWYWDGAASLSQLAVDGVSKPQNCKFTVTVPEQTVLGVIEIIPASEKARMSVQGVPEWKK
jgi:hypothetical protein